MSVHSLSYHQEPQQRRPSRTAKRRWRSPRKRPTRRRRRRRSKAKVGKRLLHQRRLRGLGGAGCRPPTHLQTRSPLFRLARSRPPVSSASPSSSPSMPSPRQGRHQVSFLLAFLPLLLVGWCTGAGSCSSVYPVGGIDALWLGFCTVNWALTAKKNCSCACHHIVVGCQFPWRNRSRVSMSCVRQVYCLVWNVKLVCCSNQYNFLTNYISFCLTFVSQMCVYNLKLDDFLSIYLMEVKIAYILVFFGLVEKTYWKKI